jgi:hypothetical protein
LLNGVHDSDSMGFGIKKCHTEAQNRREGKRLIFSVKDENALHSSLDVSLNHGFFSVILRLCVRFLAFYEVAL